ncbi:MAG: hypothetical protein IPL86_05020 [Flavobacteriales bacterium]|nr:hypothetical protein [Flavobacteriales bacterium]
MSEGLSIHGNFFNGISSSIAIIVFLVPVVYYAVDAVKERFEKRRERTQHIASTAT